MKNRKTPYDNFKVGVALQAVKRERTISEISGQFEIHPNQVIKWKELYCTREKVDTLER